MNRDAAVLSLHEVAVRYPSGTVGLEPTSLSVGRNCLTVLLGASGAGKSTLLRTLNGLVRPTAGEVRHTDLGALHDRATLRAHRRRSAMIFQQHQLIGRWHALANVLVGRLGAYPGWRTLLPMPETERRRALACLERVGLLDRALDRCDTLSGGQQQRVGIARALAQDPELFLADEPVASLDPGSGRRVLALLREICRERAMAAVVSLHQVEMAREFADRVVALSAGRVVFDGPPDGLDDTLLERLYGRAALDEPAD
jgi:phosphonate transport system ATP-binding protein